MKSRLSRRNRSFSIKWSTAIFLAFCLMLPNVGNTLAAEALTQEATPVLLPTSVGNLTLNGSANADIYISSTASELEVFAVNELKATVKKVSGADLVQATDLTSQLLHIILGTPASLPEITNLFADDLTFLANSDGFAVRMIENKIYIIGTEAKGVLNGTYDFLEENTGILWTRGIEELGTLYDPQPTISIIKVNYREKSLFDLRGWNACGQGSTGVHHVDVATRYMEGRNKQNIRPGGIDSSIGTTYIDGMIATTNGMLPFGGGITLLIEKYFAAHPEYFMTKADGTPKKDQYGSNLNFYSAETASVLADEIAAYSDTRKAKYVGHSIQDNQYFMMHNSEGVDLASLPFTADNGVTVQPTDANYKSTVFFNFLNRVAKKVKTINPDIKIVSLAYIYAEYAPAVQIEDNIIIQFAPIYSDDHLPVETTTNTLQTKVNLEDWAAQTKNIVVYNYYGSMQGTIYSRPIAKKVQADLQYYSRLGLLGLTPEGVVDSSDPQYYTNGTWNMNNLYFWLINKLFWDPYADLDALTADFCRKAYGDASVYMMQYYSLIQQGWDMFDDYVWYTSGGDTYIKKFIIDAGIADAATTALENAYNAANDLQKKRISPIKTTFAAQIDKYSNFVSEDGKAYKTNLGKDVLVSDANLNFTTGPWSEITPLTVFKGMNMEDVHKAIQVRLMWDNDNLYIAYKVPDINIPENVNEFYNKIPNLSADGTWWLGGPEFMETYIAGNIANMSEYSAYYTDAKGQQIQYNAGVAFQKGPYEWDSVTKAVYSTNPEERYWADVLVIPFSTLNVTAQTAKVAGTFVANIYGGTSSYYGWCGSNVWSTAGFRPIELVSSEPSTDIVAPVTTAEIQGTAGQNGGYASDVSVTLSTTDASVVTAVYYSLDGGANFTPYTGPIALTQCGIYQLKYYSIDSAGNVEEAKAAALAIEKSDAEHPHMIYTKQDLDAIRNHIVNGKITGYFKLANDIVFDDADFIEGGAFYNNGLGWIPIGHNNLTGYYSGLKSDIHFDGAGFSITNMKIFGTAGRYYNGFIAGPENSTIKNVTFKNTLIEAYSGTGVVYGVSYGNTIADNIVIDNAMINVLGGTASQSGIFAQQTKGIANNITVKNSTITVGNSGAWSQALFTGVLRDNTKVSNITISNCYGKLFSYSSLFAVTLNSNLEVSNVSITDTEVKYAHNRYFNFLGNPGDSGNTGKTNVLINNIYVDVKTSDSTVQSKLLIPSDEGITMTNAVMIFNQSANTPINTIANPMNPNNMDNVFITRNYPGTNGTVVENINICAAAGIRTIPTFTTGIIEIALGNTASFMTLSDGILANQISGLKFKSSVPTVAAVSVDGTVTGIGGGTALVSAYATVNGQDFVIGSSEVTVTGEDEIVSVNPVDVITAAGVAPVLPLEVTVLYSSNTTKQVNVIWDAVNPLNYAKGGSFAVNGTVEGISIKAVANVTVTNTATTTLTGANIATTGAQLEVVFGLTGVEGISAQDISLSYDNSKFEFVVAEAVFSGTSVSEATYNAEEGTIRLIIASAGASNAISGTSDIVRLKFNAIASGTGNIEVTNAMLSSGLGDVMFADTTSKTITVDADKTALIAAISAAKNILNSVVEGIETGTYPGGTKARLSFEIAKVEAISVNVLTAEQVAQAIEDLNRAVSIFQSLVITSSTGDINKIAGHDIGDLGIVSYNYGKKVGDEGWDAIKKADINGDGEIGLYDLAFVAKKILGN